MKRFLPFLVPIVLLIVAIPTLLYIEVGGLARIVGVIMVVLTSIALRFWLYRANKLRGKGAIVKLTANDRYFLDNQLSWYRNLDGSTKKMLEERIGLLLAELDFDRYDRKEVGKDECLGFAALISLISFNAEYQSALGKIVVFREINDEELIYQGDNPVLFLSEESIYSDLKKISSFRNLEEIKESRQSLLLKFYTGSIKDRK